MGIALLWKPRGVLSQQALFLFKKEHLDFEKKSGKSQIGHTGTLDPFAEGLLLVAWLEGTKLLYPLQGLEKTYIVGMRFGETSDTLDGTGQIQAAVDATKDLILKKAQTEWRSPDFFEKFLTSKIGHFEQVPPAFSAIHVDGRRAYDLAREGKTVELKARPAEILSAKHISFDSKNLEWLFEVKVSSGTYIRSLARDWGTELCGFPGRLETLVRTAIGEFRMTGEAPYKILNIEDLKPYFGTLLLGAQEAEELKNNGLLRRSLKEISSKPLILLGPDKRPVAWVEGGSGKLGRVFKTDPF